ncbi:MAG TPA: NfeD family protein [Burkholderiaceae bacterium]|nr:NfeD family protein [Burkholderiaceae bacterium]
MTLDASVGWWVAAGVTVAAELATGTFYLLMCALGLAAGALAAHVGLPISLQFVSAALVGGGAVALWHVRRRSHPRAPASANPDVNLDIGERVHVTHWDADGCARVHYRGAQWSARWAGDAPPQTGVCVIRAVEGNHLLLGR